jgi:hypothetical protein
MALTAAYFRLCASEAKDAARRSRDPRLSGLFLDIAQSYEALAENQQWLNAARPPVTQTPRVAPH